jgi:hypothetical protein
VAPNLRRALLCQKASLSGKDPDHPFQNANRRGCARLTLSGASRQTCERHFPVREMFEPLVAFEAVDQVRRDRLLFPLRELVG